MVATSAVTPQTQTFEARVVDSSPSLPRRAFYIATGLRLVGHAVRVAGSIAGLRTQAAVTLVPAGVELKSRTGFMGVSLGEKHELYPTSAITSVGRESKSGAMLVIVGVIGLIALLLFGVSTAFYGLIGRSGSLLGFAISVIALGVIGDVLLFFGAAARRAQGYERVIFSAAGRRYVLAAVPKRDAEAFVKSVTQRLTDAARG
jgi:hypothetical protein